MDNSRIQQQQRSQDPPMSPPDRSHTFPIPSRQHSSEEQGYRKQSSMELPRHRGPPPSGRRPSRDDHFGNSPQKQRPQHRSRPSGQSRTCGKCQQPLLGQFVRAMGDTYHLDCFTCSDCGKVVASKFFPVPEHPPNQYPLCETDYFRRLDLLCHQCGGALRGSYITALDRKYHIEHFTCSVCPTVFGAQDSYYEHEGSVYCHYHYSTKFAQRCNGCQTAILKQFVEIFRNGANQHWHPECYMIHKYWNVRLTQAPEEGVRQLEAQLDNAMGEGNATEEMRRVVRDGEEQVEEKVHWIWRTLSSFEEKSATCISDMLLHVSNGAYVDGIMSAKKFIFHVDVLFNAADDLHRGLLNLPRNEDKDDRKGLNYSREAKLLCKKVVAFFQLLAESQETGVRRLGVTQELLSLVTGLAHYLKLVIRICLQGALKLERESRSSSGLNVFLEDIGKLDEKLDNETDGDSISVEPLAQHTADLCGVCGKSVEDRCYKRQDCLVHAGCFKCAKCERPLVDAPATARWSEASQQVLCELHASSGDNTGFVEVSRLQQYVYLLRVAHARLLDTLRTSKALPHTSDDPNLADYDSRSGHRVAADGTLSPRLLQTGSRSKSYTDSSQRDGESSYKDTLGDIRRLRSTRMEQHMTNATRKARNSRLIDAPDAMRMSGADAEQSRMDRSAGEPTQQLAFSNNESMTLDDIPRLVQAQQTREQRPNASRYARQPMIPQEPKVKLVNGHTRSGPQTMDDKQHPIEGGRRKRYFSELSALEYFIVRHVAVLSLEPLLEGYFNQEQLLDLIETKRPTFWGKFGKAFGKNENKGKNKKKGVFGVALEQLVERDYAESTDGIGPGALRIPALLQDAVSAMKTMDMSIEGVFRKNGSLKRLNDLKEEIDSNGTEQVDLTKENPVQVANMLKKFLRDLPDPLLTFKLHKLWITSTKITDDEKRRRVLHLTCCLLPKAHRDTMEVLFNFLVWVSSFSHVDEESGSKMDMHNLATVITPNILYMDSKPEGKAGGGPIESNVNDSFMGIEAVHELIYHNDAMCEIPEDLSLILNDSSLFSASADITTKEILKRYGERARAPTTTANPGAAVASPSPSGGLSRDNGSVSGRTPVATRVDGDENAWNNESSVRHVREEWAGESREELPRRAMVT